MPAKTNRRAPARRRPSTREKRVRPKVRQHLAPWARDALGIGLMVFALISMLGLWFDAAGFVGRGIELMLEALVGQAAVLFPLLALYWGVLLLRGTRRRGHRVAHLPRSVATRRRHHLGRRDGTRDADLHRHAAVGSVGQGPRAVGCGRR